MGTRGLFGVIAGEKTKVGYNQFDSYPDGRGIEILGWIRGVVEDDKVAAVRQLALDAKLIDETTTPTPEDVAALADVTDLGVSNQSTDDWYCLTRKTHGDIAAMLASGYILDSVGFAADSLFCEWGYIANFDDETLEVYQGFQKKPHSEGRFASEANDDGYYPIRLVATYPFAALPTDEAFVEALEALDED